ncbi:MAG: prephenate dehydrogenase [Chloroflexota bacterium]
MRIAIIGGSGQMGQWLARFLRQDGQEVVITGRDQARLREASRELGVAAAPLSEAVEGADAVVISVPIDSVAEVARQLGPHTRAGQAIIDITSVKVSPLEALHRHIKAGTVLGVHPMFGPGARGLAHQNFILTPTGPAEAELAGKVSRYLAERQASATLMTPEEHDQTMAVVLGLSHFVAIVAADTLLELDHLQESQSISGSSYKLLLALAEGVVSQEPAFYASLQMSLPNMARLEKRFQETAGAWADLVAGADQAGFARRLTDLKARLAGKDPDFNLAYQNMYRIFEGLKQP